MGALSFKERFVESVLAGLQRRKGGKRQSIRNFRKRPLKVGERVVLYYAQRTKWCRKLGEDLIKSRQVIRIHTKEPTGLPGEITIYDEIRGRLLNGLLKFSKTYKTAAELNRFARADGSRDFDDMKAFWIAEHGKKKSPFPYTGNLYKW